MDTFTIFIVVILLVLLFVVLGAFVFFKNSNNNVIPPESEDSFEFDVNIVDLNYKFLISTFASNISLIVDWGDDTIESFNGNIENVTLTHSYSTIGNYKIKITKLKNYVGISNYFDEPVVNKITSMTFIKMQKLKFLTIRDSLLTDLNLNDSKEIVNIDLQYNTLTQESVDNILVSLNNFNTTYEIGTNGGTIDLSNQNPPMAPSAAGLAAKADLESRNWTVIVDP